MNAVAAHQASAPARAPQVRPPAAPQPRHGRGEGGRGERPRLEVVRPPGRKLRTGPTVALGAVLAFGIAFAVVACQVILVQGQERLDQLDRDLGTATDQYDQLRLQVAELESPERIVDAATTGLGMVPPPEVTYLTPSGAVTVAGAADPGSRPDHLAEHADTRPNLEGGG